MTLRNALILSTALLALGSTAWAKLPPPSDEAKAMAAEAAAKSAYGAKLDAYKLCLAMDRVVASYQAAAKAAGKSSVRSQRTPNAPKASAYFTKSGFFRSVAMTRSAPG